MTIAIAITCSDGVVLASDSMGTAGRHATQMQKVQQASSNSVLWASSGTEYLTSLVNQTIADPDLPSGLTPDDLAGVLDPAIRKALKRPLKQDGPDAIEHSVETLLVSWQDGDASIIHLPADLAALDCHEKTLTAIGSAHDYAHVVASTLRHQFDPKISVVQAELLAYRIIKVVCDTSSWGVAPPIQMGVGDAKGSRVLSQAEVEAIGLAVDRWQAAEADQFTGGEVKLGPNQELPSLATADAPDPESEVS